MFPGGAAQKQWHKRCAIQRVLEGYVSDAVKGRVRFHVAIVAAAEEHENCSQNVNSNKYCGVNGQTHFLIVVGDPLEMGVKDEKSKSRKTDDRLNCEHSSRTLSVFLQLALGP